ncbi:MAG: hypothetical protein K8T20_20765 [Planctomycetes bacterium]|nr:hypothetical protein [Planctomycetota bacterium]
MPEKEFEQDDPLEFVGMAFPAGPEADEAMARAVVEEFLLHGLDRDRLVRLFQDPFYAGTHRLWVERGPAFVEGVIDTVLREWSPSPEFAP